MMRIDLKIIERANEVEESIKSIFALTSNKKIYEIIDEEDTVYIRYDYYNRTMRVEVDWEHICIVVSQEKEIIGSACFEVFGSNAIDFIKKCFINGENLGVIIDDES